MSETIDDIAQEIIKLQNKRKKLENQAEEIKKEEEVKKTQLYAMAETAKLTFGGNKKASWRIELKTVPQVTDWDAFYAYIAENKYFHLLQRRPAVTAVQELWGQKNGKFQVPGVEKFSKNVVNVKEA